MSEPPKALADLADKYELNTSNILGIGYDSFRNKMYKIALSKPGYYFEMRDAILSYLKDDLTKLLYTKFYYLFLLGTTTDKKTFLVREAPISGTDGPGICPNFPIPKIQKFCAEAAATVGELCDDCLSMLLPKTADEILNRKMAVQGLMPETD